MSVKWYPMGEMTRYFLTKSNQRSAFRRFRDLIMVNMSQTDPSNGKKVNINKREVRIKVSKSRKSKKISEQHYQDHKHPQECIAGQRTDRHRYYVRTTMTVDGRYILRYMEKPNYVKPHFSEFI